MWQLLIQRWLPPNKRAKSFSSRKTWFSNEFTITSAMWKCNHLIALLEICTYMKKKKKTKKENVYTLNLSLDLAPHRDVTKARSGFHRQVVTHSHNEFLNHRYSHIKGGSIVSRCCGESRMWSIRRGIFLQWC